MNKPIDRSTPVAAVSAPPATTTATPDYSTAVNPPSIFFSGHPHTLTISGAELDAAAAKPAGTETIFAVGGAHPHNLHLTTEQAQALIKDGVVKSTADGGHSHTVTFKRQASGDVLAFMQPMAPAQLTRSSAILPVAFPKGGIPINDALHYFVRSSVDGKIMGRGFRQGEGENAKRSMILTDVANGTTLTFDFGAYDPSFAKDFFYFQGFDEQKQERCFVVSKSFVDEQMAKGSQTLSLEWFAKNAPNELIRIEGILVYQDLPVSRRFAVQCTGQVWDEAIKPPTNVDYIPKAGSFPPLGEIWFTPLETPTTSFKIEVGEVGNVQLNDLGDRAVAQRVVGDKCEFVVYAIEGEVAAGKAAPTLKEVYSVPAQADKADMYGHRWLTFERRASADSSELVLHDMQKGKDYVIMSAKPDCVLKFPHFVGLPEGGGKEVRFVEQQWAKDANGKYTGATNVYRSVTII